MPYNNRPCNGTAGHQSQHCPPAPPTQENWPASGPHHARQASATPAGSGARTNAGKPSPRAIATDPQEPEPWPANCRLTRTAPGHGPPGNATKQPRPAATARTSAAERAGKAKAPEPKAEARNTCADGRAARTAASTPEAQPTSTEQEAGSAAASCPGREAADEEAEREPEKPAVE